MRLAASQAWPMRLIIIPISIYVGAQLHSSSLPMTKAVLLSATPQWRARSTRLLESESVSAGGAFGYSHACRSVEKRRFVNARRANRLETGPFPRQYPA